jgi:hypothetical protein
MVRRCDMKILETATPSVSAGIAIADNKRKNV